MRIKMLENVIPYLPFLAKPGPFLYAGVEYEAMANKNGAISALCENGEYMGVKPGEFEFWKRPSGFWRFGRRCENKMREILFRGKQRDNGE